MDKKLPFSSYVVVGVMLFALFFGAGNLIFPALLGQKLEQMYGPQQLDF